MGNKKKDDINDKSINQKIAEKNKELIKEDLPDEPDINEFIDGLMHDTEEPIQDNSLDEMTLLFKHDDIRDVTRITPSQVSIFSAGLKTAEYFECKEMHDYIMHRLHLSLSQDGLSRKEIVDIVKSKNESLTEDEGGFIRRNLSKVKEVLT